MRKKPRNAQVKQNPKKGRGIFFFSSLLFLNAIEQFETTRDSHAGRLFAAARRFYFCETPPTPMSRYWKQPVFPVTPLNKVSFLFVQRRAFLASP